MTNDKGTRRSLNYNGTHIAIPAPDPETCIVPLEASSEQSRDRDSDTRRRNVRGTAPLCSYDAHAGGGLPTPNVAAEDTFGYARARRFTPIITVIDGVEGTRHNDPQAAQLDAFSYVYRTSATVCTRCELTAYLIACKKLR